MPTQCVMVADVTRARFFTLDGPDDETAEGGPDLTEREDLKNPEGDLMGRELYANTKSGRNRAPGGPAHGYDDHRDAHRAEMERRFARRIAAQTRAFVEERRANRLVLVVAPRLLGFVREQLSRELPDGIDLVELSENLSWQTAAEIQDLLARKGIIPQRRPPASSVFRPRAQPPPRS